MLGISVILSYAVFVYLCICEFVFVYLCIWQSRISFLMSLDPWLFQKYSIIRVYKVFRAWWRTTTTRNSEQSWLLQQHLLGAPQWGVEYSSGNSNELYWTSTRQRAHSILADALGTDYFRSVRIWVFHSDTERKFFHKIDLQQFVQKFSSQNL